MTHLAEVMGHWPARSAHLRPRAKPCDLVVFTVNDPFHMLLYAYKGFDAIGTDKPRLMRDDSAPREKAARRDQTRAA